MVYALLSCAADKDKMDKLRPDYNKSKEQLFKDLVTCCGTRDMVFPYRHPIAPLLLSGGHKTATGVAIEVMRKVPSPARIDSTRSGDEDEFWGRKLWTDDFLP